MANWRGEMRHLGLDLCGGGQSLLDLRSADDILLSGTDYHVIAVLLTKLVENFAAGVLQLNAPKNNKNKNLHNTGPTTVTIANAEWIDHIGS